MSEQDVMQNLRDLLPDVPMPDEPPAKAVEPRPAIKEPWDPTYNPVTDATAVTRFGATWVRPGRYLDQSGLLMDANGSLVDQDECPGCGSTPGHDASRWVRIPCENPFAPPYEHDWTYCKVCTPMYLRADLPERRPGPRKR